MKVLSVVGNRPQFIKSGPVSAAWREAGVEEVGLHTGQHWDPELSDVFYAELGLPEPRYRLDLHTADAETMRPAIAAALAQEQPDWTLVFGDTNSTRAGTEAAGDAGVPVAHVEAGLRSGDLSMPEEHNRIAVDAAATLLLCPDERSRETLLAEGVTGRIDVVGDVMGDARRDASQRRAARAGRLSRHGRARLAGARPRHRLGRAPEGGVLVRRSLRDCEAFHGVDRHRRARRERARGRRPREARGSGRVGADAGRAATAVRRWTRRGTGRS